MIVTVQRNVVTPNSTIGQLVVMDKECFTLEDPTRKIKVWGQTCIPAGQYVLKLRKEGGMDMRYAARFGNWHRGMLWLQDVPNFEYVYLHIGNTPADTEGCILVGSTVERDAIGGSEAAYREIYPVIADAIEAGDDVLLDVRAPTGG